MNNSRRRSEIWTIPLEKFVTVIRESANLSEALRKFNLGDVNGNHKTIKARIQEENIDISHMNPYKYNGKVKYSLDEILIKNSTYKNRTKLKERLIKKGLLEEKCYKCKLGTMWNNLPLTLQLEHKNGINDDHRLENLALICPNCHTQTETYAGKNTRKNKLEFLKSVRENGNSINNIKLISLKEEKQKIKCTNCSKKISNQSKTNLCPSCYAETTRKVERPSKEELLKLILTYPFTTIAKQYGVSDNAIRKWCRLYDLPTTKKEIKAYLTEQTLEIIRE